MTGTDDDVQRIVEQIFLDDVADRQRIAQCANQEIHFSVPQRRQQVSIGAIENGNGVNASIRLGTEAGKWRLVVGVNNATDEVYPIAGNSSLTTGSGYAEIAYARPRQYFGYLQYDF